MQTPGGLLPPGVRGGPRGLGDGLQLAAEARWAAVARRAAGSAAAAHGRLDGGGAHDGPAGRRRRPEQPRLHPGLRARGGRAAATATAPAATAAAGRPSPGGRGGRGGCLAIAIADAAGDIGGVVRGAGPGHHAVQHGRVRRRRRRRAAAAPPRGPRQSPGKTFNYTYYVVNRYARR